MPRSKKIQYEKVVALARRYGVDSRVVKKAALAGLLKSWRFNGPNSHPMSTAEEFESYLARCQVTPQSRAQARHAERVASKIIESGRAVR